MPTALDQPASPDLKQESMLARLSARFGVAFAVCQISVMIAMAILVLPKGGSPDDPARERGQAVFDHATAYQLGNYAFILAGTLLIGFLGVVHLKLLRADRTGVLATVAVSAGSLLALIWPLAGVFHDVALETADMHTDLRILAGWDSIAPFSLAFSVLPRLFFIGAIVLGLRASSCAPRLQRIGVVLIPLSLVGSATLITGAMFPVLALSTLGYELWVGAVAWHWLRSER